MSEVQRVVMEHACTELDMLLKEEAHRSHTEPDRVPKDSVFKVSLGKLRSGQYALFSPILMLVNMEFQSLE